ncbi:MAG: TM2 domain-containing protein [Bacteroidota bacterium]|nr:MAG: TM2 domain-containing protein [Bacteroidota bacterium]
MEASKVDMFLMTHSKFFESYQIPAIRERMLAADDSRFTMLHSAGFKDPTISIIVSLFAGTFGIDRFIIGDTGLGVAKLLTCGGLYVWTIVDWFLIMGRTREVNMEKLQTIL